MSPKPIQIALEHPKTVLKVLEHPKTISKGPGMAKNGPGRSWKLPEGSGSFRTVS